MGKSSNITAYAPEASNTGRTPTLQIRHFITRKAIGSIKNSTHTFITMILLFNSTYGQQSAPTKYNMMEEFELSPDTAHPNARRLLTEDFYWSPIEETGPFGSDDGSDSFYGFAEWRMENKKESPVNYLRELLQEWGYQAFDLNVTDAEQIKKLLAEIDSRMLIGQDNAVIAVGFGQFVLEGKIDNDIRDLTRKAILRELTPDLLNMFRSDYIEIRKGQLQKMLIVVDKMPQ